MMNRVSLHSSAVPLLDLVKILIASQNKTAKSNPSFRVQLLVSIHKAHGRFLSLPPPKDQDHIEGFSR